MAATYTPSPGPEAAAYESLWKIANPSGGDLSGAQAVAFFRKSDVESSILKQIWGLSTPLATMNNSQFNVALRFITMAQNGDLPLSAERLASSASKNYGPANNVPKFKDLAAGPGPAGGPAGGPTYAMTPEDHVKYFDLFQRYDTDKDGFITGAEAIPIFVQSGLSQPVLSAIWDIADDDKDARLSTKEFCVAFHIIVCVGKRNLPQPTSLPPALKNFLVAAPVNPHAPGSAPAPSAAPAAAAAVAVVSASSAAASSMPSPSRVSVETSRRPEPTVTSASGPDVSSDLAASVSTISAASQRALKTADGLVAASASSNTSLTQLVQKLAAEKISILAAIDAAEADAEAKKKQLAVTIEEIRSLEGQLSDLRTQLDQKRASGHVSQGQLGEAVLQKQNLMNQITQARGEIAQLSSEISSVSMDVGKSEGLRAELQDKSAALDKDKASLAQEVGSLNSELAFLQSILASLQGDKDGRATELARVQGQRGVSQQALQRERGSVEMKEKEVEVLRSQKQALTAQKQDTLDAISTKVASGATVAAAKSTPATTAPAAAAPVKATPAPAPAPVPVPVVEPAPVDDFAASSAFDFAPSTPTPAAAPAHTLSAPADDFAPSPSGFEPSVQSPSAAAEPAFGDFGDFPEPAKVSFEEGTKEDAFQKPTNAPPSRSQSAETPSKSLVRMSSESSVLSVDPFDPFRPSKASNSIQSTKSYIPKDVVVTEVEDDGDDFDGDFDKNPFESPFGSSSDAKALQAAAKGNQSHQAAPVDSGFADDAFAPSSADAFAPSSADDFAPSAAGSALPAGHDAANTGDFGFSGFDKNPFEDVPADVFGGSSSAFDAFGSSSGPSPFDSFGDAPAATGEKKADSGFDEW